jgi:hypothetical protein
VSRFAESLKRPAGLLNRGAARDLAKRCLRSIPRTIRMFSTVSRRTILLKEVLSKLGEKWDRDVRVWRMPAARTRELVAACKEKQVKVAEVGDDKSKGPELF